MVTIDRLFLRVFDPHFLNSFVHLGHVVILDLQGRQDVVCWYTLAVPDVDFGLTSLLTLGHSGIYGIFSDIEVVRFLNWMLVS